LEDLPIIGKKSSNDWKKREKNFQRLETFIDQSPRVRYVQNILNVLPTKSTASEFRRFSGIYRDEVYG